MDRYDDIKRSLMGKNPSDKPSYNITPETLNLNFNLDHLALSPSPENHFRWQNPISISQNRSPATIHETSMTPRNSLYQNPGSQNQLLLQETHPQLPNYHQMNLGGEFLESGLYLNPSFADPVGLQNHDNVSLEAALSRINLSSTTPRHQTHQFLENNYRTNRGYSSPDSQEQALIMMRSISAGLGLLRANSNSAVDRYYQNGGSNLAILNQSFSNYGNNSRIPRGTSSHDGLNYGYSVRPNLNRLDSGSHQFSRARSINELESMNSNIWLAPLYNRQIVGNHEDYSSLEELRGRMAMAAREQDACRFLQKKVDESKPEQTEMIFLELKDHLYDLIMDQFANYLIQKLFVACNKEQLSQLLLSLVQNGERLKNICIHQHGTRPMQKLIEEIKDYPEEKSLLVSALKNITVYLVKNHNGHHVIQQCLKCFDADYNQYLLEEIAQSCLEIATDKSGCCVLQKALDKANGELKERILAEITDNAFALSVDPYGNYVVQYVLQMHIPHAEVHILNQLRGNYVNLSMDKYGSNVVEKCLKECNELNAAEIIRELIHSPLALEVLQHPFGNYVIQSALLAATGDLYHELVSRINEFYHQLHSHLHGKKVLARTRSGNRNNRVLGM